MGDAWSARLLFGDAFAHLAALPDNSVDAVVTDPPYGIRESGDAWDSDEIHDSAVKEHRAQGSSGDRTARPKLEIELRTMEAGSYDYSIAGMRAFQEWSRAWAEHAIRIVKPGGYVLSFSSPRTYHRMATGIEDAGFDVRDSIVWLFAQAVPKSIPLDASGRDGWGTNLKPGHEPVVMARRPFQGTTRGNVAAHGTGLINIDGCRVGGDWPRDVGIVHLAECKGSGPTHVELCAEGCPVAALEASWPGSPRFYFVSKARPRERIGGTVRNLHPTVKPIDIMRHLVRLVTPPEGIVLDPFAGSGTTGCAAILEGLHFIGIERDEPSYEAAFARISDYAFANGRERPIRS